MEIFWRCGVGDNKDKDPSKFRYEITRCDDHGRRTEGREFLMINLYLDEDMRDCELIKLWNVGAGACSLPIDLNLTFFQTFRC